MKKVVILLVLLIIGMVIYKPVINLLSSSKDIIKNSDSEIQEKVYVALEGEGKIAIIDPNRKKVIKTIDLTINDQDNTIELSPHNIQVAPDNKSVWVTANFVENDMDGHSFKIIKSSYANSEGDYIIKIDPFTDTITELVPLLMNNHLAHIALTPNSKFAYATAQEKDVIYKLDTVNNSIEKIIPLPKGSNPHGLRISVDGTKAYVAEMGGKALGILNLNTEEYKKVSLNGAVVQTAVTADSKYVYASVYDTKSIARYEIATGKITYIILPNGAQGPVQLYSTPDSKYLYVADQGYYFEKPNNNKVYKIDISTSKVIQEITSGEAPHGVVISPNSKTVYITNLISDDVSVIDTSSDTEIVKIAVGKMPNGISYWKRP